MVEHVDGLVVAAFGAGHVRAAVAPVLGKLAEASRSCWPLGPALALSTASRTVSLDQNGTCWPRGLISGGYLDPLKARILLHLLIASGLDNTGTWEAFAAADVASELYVSELSEGAPT
jgi:L-asparaginase